MLGRGNVFPYSFLELSLERKLSACVAPAAVARLPAASQPRPYLRACSTAPHPAGQPSQHGSPFASPPPLQHRYYGKSLPVLNGNTSDPATFRYLSIEQALTDYVKLIQVGMLRGDLHFNPATGAELAVRAGSMRHEGFGLQEAPHELNRACFRRPVGGISEPGSLLARLCSDI